MIHISSQFPFQSGTLNGFLTYLNQESLTDFLVTSTIYPIYSDHSGSYCVDRNPNTFCHTSNQAGEIKYFLVHLKNISFKVEGYSFQNRNLLANNPNNWVFEGSNDGSIFFELDKQVTSDQCVPGIIRSFPISTNLHFSYFRLVFSDISCDGSEYFNIAEFELFGNTIIPNSCQSCAFHHIHAHVFPLIFIFSLLLANGTVFFIDISEIHVSLNFLIF